MRLKLHCKGIHWPLSHELALGVSGWPIARGSCSKAEPRMEEGRKNRLEIVWGFYLVFYKISLVREWKKWIYQIWKWPSLDHLFKTNWNNRLQEAKNRNAGINPINRTIFCLLKRAMGLSLLISADSVVCQWRSDVTEEEVDILAR